MNLRELRELQRVWSEGQSASIQNGAADNVFKVFHMLVAKEIPIGPVCEIGPQYGYGLDALATLADSVSFIEIVPKFFRACIEKGYTADGMQAEDIVKIWLSGPVNWYMRDVAEHFFDADRAWEGIRKNLKDWLYLSVPIEPEDSKDKAHLSQFRSKDDVLARVDGLTEVWSKYRRPTPNLIGRMEGIWRKEQ